MNQVHIGHAGHGHPPCSAMFRKGESDRSLVPLNHFLLGGVPSEHSCPNSSLRTIVPYTRDRVLGGVCVPSMPLYCPEGWCSRSLEPSSESQQPAHLPHPAQPSRRQERAATHSLPQQGDGSHRDWHPGFDAVWWTEKEGTLLRERFTPMAVG